MPSFRDDMISKYPEYGEEYFNECTQRANELSIQWLPRCRCKECGFYSVAHGHTPNFLITCEISKENRVTPPVIVKLIYVKNFRFIEKIIGNRLIETDEEFNKAIQAAGIFDYRRKINFEDKYFDSQMPRLASLLMDPEASRAIE